MQTKTSETCGGFDHEKKTMLADKAVANKTTANSRNSTRTWRRVHGDWFPGCSSSTESRAREALSGLLTGSGYCGPWGSTIQRSTLTFFSMSSIMRSMRQISCSMMPCSWISRPAAGTWLSAWFRSGRLSARAATSLPPPVIPPPPKSLFLSLLWWNACASEIVQGFTLEAILHQFTFTIQWEDGAHSENFAHVDMEELQAGGERHPEELHLLTLLLREALVSQM